MKIILETLLSKFNFPK